jgi:hypothetical protein
MARKPSSIDDGSLELLLDTICNTFGGVLFISMLVVILLNMSSEQAAVEPPDAAAQEKLVRLEGELAASTEELEQLQTAVALQQRVIDQVVDPDARQVLTDWQRQQGEFVRLLQARGVSLGHIGESQVETNDIALKIKQMEDAAAAARRKLEDLQQQVEREISTRSRTAKLPRVRTTSKTPVAMFLRGGRLTAFARVGAGGDLEMNPAEVAVRADAGVDYAEPVPGAGLAIDPDGRAKTAVEQKLRGYDPNRHFIHIFVWPDSFAHFGPVKDVMVARNFEYSLQPVPDDERIPITDQPQHNTVQ